jgi:hypothetical protein
MVQRIGSARKQQIPYGNDSKKSKSKNESATVSLPVLGICYGLKSKSKNESATVSMKMIERNGPHDRIVTLLFLPR